MFRLSLRSTVRRGSTGAPTGRSKRTAGFILAAAGIATALVAGSPVTAQAAPPVTINLITVNDFHGRIERSTPSAGAAAIATAVQDFRTANANTVFAAAGDLIGASTFTSFIANDVPTIDALNAAGLEVSAVGNHEFDQGYSDLMNRVLPLANWEYVGANVKTTNGDPNLPEYWVKDMAGVKMGFIGAVTDELSSLVSPAGIANLTIQAPVTAANRVADLLTDGNAGNGEADVIVLLVHEGAATTDIASATDPTSRFGKIVNGASSKIDAIVSGHTHLAYNHVINGRPVISSGQYGEKFSNMVISVDPDTKNILSMTNTVYDAFAYTAALTPNPTVAGIVSAAVSNATTLGSVVLGNVTAAFNRGNFAAAGDNRGTESTLGNFVADVQLWSAKQNGRADIALMNPGGLRADIAADGSVTYKDAADVQPFANTLVTMDMTGTQLKLALEQQWQPSGSSRPVLRLGMNKELSYVYDPAAAAGSHILQITFNGTVVKPTDVFRVVVNSFLAAGGDNFGAFATGTNKSDSGKVDLQSMVDYFAANPSATPDYTQRSVGVNLAGRDADGFEPGEPITINLSSLDYTTTETKSGTVNVSLGGVSLGSATVDPAKVAARDEAGQAQIVTTVPAGLAGVQNLAITVPATGTTATVPIVLSGTPPTLAPERLLDTRQGANPSPIGDRQMTEIQVADRAGVPASAVAVALNVTVDNAVKDGYLTVWPCGVTMPTASNVNYKAGQTVPNMVFSKVGTGGKVCIYADGSTSVIVDATAWFGSTSAYQALTPERLLDTRAGAGPKGYTGDKPAAGQTVRLQVTGAGASQVPTGVDAVVLNLTGTDATGAGFVTAWPCDATMPTASSLNLDAGGTRANLAVTRVSATGEVCLYTEMGTHLIADVAGYFPAGSGYQSVVPQRILETRSGAGLIGYTGSKPAAGSTVELQVTGVGTANLPSTASSVILNVTGTDATADGYVTVWACGATMPTTSNLNLTKGGTAPNLVIAKVGTGGKVCIYTEKGTHLVADLLGWFGTPPA